MKNYFKISAFIALLFLLTAEDCGSGFNEAEQVETAEYKMYSELERGFVADELDDEKLKALEKRAIQKFNELSDYMNIYSDSSLNVQFRKQAGQMMKEAFVSEKEWLIFIESMKLTEAPEQYLLLNAEGELAVLKLKLPAVEKPFMRLAMDYRAQLNYQFQDSTKIIGVLATKKTKRFGDEALFVWELFFENDEVK